MKNLAWWMRGVRGRCALGAVTVLATVALLPGDTAQAQQGQGQYLTEAAARLGKLIASANKDGYYFYNNQFSVGGGWLQQGENNWVNLYTVTLEAGKNYRLMAAGDADARDVDLEIKDLNGKQVALDEDTASEAVINFSPTVTQKYLVRVRLFDSGADKQGRKLPCMCLAIVMVKK
jgi:hypothetical protein